MFYRLLNNFAQKGIGQFNIFHLFGFLLLFVSCPDDDDDSDGDRNSLVSE
jgi:hypothetical protein